MVLNKRRTIFCTQHTWMYAIMFLNVSYIKKLSWNLGQICLLFTVNNKRL